jgi:hypothetical protein
VKLKSCLKGEAERVHVLKATLFEKSLASAKISPDMVGGGRNSRNLRAKARQLFRAHQVLLRTLIAGRK